jgi:hypothetical protein
MYPIDPGTDDKNLYRHLLCCVFMERFQQLHADSYG